MNHRRDTRRGSTHTTTRTRTAAAGIAVALVSALSLTACAGGSGTNPDGSPVAVGAAGSDYRGSQIRSGYPLPDQHFTDTSGHAFVPRQNAQTPVTLLFFGYSHCPDLCNVVLANVAAALRRTPSEVRDRTQLLFITTDPQRDTVPVMKEYLGRFDPSFVGLRANVATMKKAAAEMHISYSGKTKVTGGGYEVSHGLQLTGFRDGKASVEWSPETSVADLRADFETLASG